MLAPRRPLQPATDRPTLPLAWPARAHRALLAPGALAVVALAVALLARSPWTLVRTSGSGSSATVAAAPATGAATDRLSASGAALGVSFAHSGPRLHAGALKLSLALRAAGYAGRLRAVPATAPSGGPNRVTYAHSGIEEWYVDGARGLEQGFELARALPGASGAPLALAIGYSGNAHAELSRGGQSIVFSGPAGSSLRYGQLRVTDASGRLLRSRLSLGRGSVVLSTQARGARYPLHVDPLVQLGTMIRAGGEELPAGAFGTSIAISGDGYTAIAGAPRNDGAVFAFARTGASWGRQGPQLIGRKEGKRETEELCDEEPALEVKGCGFGASVALSEDGNTALVGSPVETAPCPTAAEPARECFEQGAVSVYVRVSGAWVRQALLNGGEEESSGGRFGRAVALSADGNTALVGAPADGSSAGAAWIFTRSGATWTQQGAKLLPSNETGSGRFGYAVALSADGSTALIGAPANNSFTGAAWSFTRSGSSWAQGQTFTAGEGEVGEAHFGGSVALSSNASLALVGGYGDSAERGAAWSFAHSGAGWGPPEKLIGAVEHGAGQFGFSVSLSGDGSTALIGGPGDRTENGGAWVFSRSGGAWLPEVQKIAGGSDQLAKARFGTSVALSANASQALIGGPREADGSGAMWAFTQPPEGQPVAPNEEAPVVEGIEPAEGPTSGGTTVRIRGQRLRGGAVYFGGVAASETGNTDRLITALAPAHAASTVHVVVNVGGSASATSARDQFTYTTPSPGGGGGGGTGLEEVPPPAPAPAPGILGLPGLGALVFTQSAPAPHCSASAPAKSLAVNSKAHATLRLVLAGRGTCRGRLTLTVRKKVAHHHPVTKTIATATFSTAAGRTVVLTLALNKLGRALLHAGHGKLGAILTVLKLSPAPASAHSASVRLAAVHSKAPAKH
jgi:hypothetical protein